MSLRRVLFLTISGLLAAAGTSWAQPAYVGASLMGDIVRTTHTESGGFDGSSGGGEAVGFALRVGTGLGSNWGVELEYARPSVVKKGGELVYPLFASPLTPEQQAAILASLPNAPAIFPPIFPIPRATETRDRHSSVSAVLWANQRVTERVALVYLGGVAFNRFDREYGYSFDFAPTLFSVSQTVTYSARPVVGLESWIGLTEHVTLMPGLRLLGIQDGWSIRPAVGLGWSF